MINKRKLDEVIGQATYEPEEHCGYSFEDYCLNPKYQEHVCRYVRNCWMPYLLAKYLYTDCYYDDIETIKANLNYVNLEMKKLYETWIDMNIEAILKEIEQLKEKDVQETESSGDDIIDPLFDDI